MKFLPRVNSWPRPDLSMAMSSCSMHSTPTRTPHTRSCKSAERTISCRSKAIKKPCSNGRLSACLHRWQHRRQHPRHKNQARPKTPRAREPFPPRVLPPPPCATAVTREPNRGRIETRSARLVAAEAETLCFPFVKTVAEITREVVDKKGRSSVEITLYLSSLPPDNLPPQKFLTMARHYWGIETGLHARLDVTAREDHSRVRNRNSLLALGMVRRTVMGLYYRWRHQQCGARRSTLADFHDSMRNHNCANVWRLLLGHSP